MNNDLISRQAVLDVITVVLNGFLTEDERERLEDICVEIEEMPSAVKRGKWISQKGGGFCCSECGRYALSEVEGNYVLVSARTNYCPYCGAKMEDDDETCD